MIWAAFIVGPLLVLGLLVWNETRRRRHGRLRLCLLAWLAFCLSKFLVFQLLGGSAFCPELPEKLIWFWDWAYSGAVLYLALKAVGWRWSWRWKTSLFALLGWTLSVWGLVNGLRVPEVREVEISFDCLPPELDGYRIVQLSDLHASCAARRWRTQAIVDRVNAIDADLVCLTGDYADGFVGKSRSFVEPLAGLHARDGVYGCTGNHEYYFLADEWRREFYNRLNNVEMLSNRCVYPRNGLALAGVPDKTGYEYFGEDEFPNASAAFAAATNGEFRVLLCHRPATAFEHLGSCIADLQLSGHTHGGITPLFQPLIGLFNNGYTRGLYRLGDAALYVSPGCGQWGGFPMRFFNPSEITLITLRRTGKRN